MDMKRKFKKWWSAISPISTKQTIVSHINSHKHKKDDNIWRWEIQGLA